MDLEVGSLSSITDTVIDKLFKQSSETVMV